MDLEEEMKKGKEDEERHMKEVGLLWKSLEDTRKRKEQQEKSIKRLRKENRKLVEENLRSKRIWTRKFEDLTEKVLDLGNDVEILKNEREKEGSRKGRETGDTSGGTDNNGQSSGNPNQVAASGDKRRKRVLMREEGDVEERTKDAVEEELAKCREELMICKGRLAEFECQESKFAEERGRLLEESRKAYIKGCVHGAKDCATACVDLAPIPKQKPSKKLTAFFTLTQILKISLFVHIPISKSFHLFKPNDRPSTFPPPMASAVDSNDSIYLNMTLSELISMLREAEAEKTKLKEEVEKKTRETELMKERAELERLDKMKAEMDLAEEIKKGEEAVERHAKEVVLMLINSVEDTSKMEEQHKRSIKRLRKENRKLVEENLRSEGSWTRKFEDLTEKVLDLGNDVEILKNEREKEGSRKGRETGDTSGGTDNNGQSSGNPNQVAASGDKRRKRVLMREDGDVEERTKDVVEEELAKCREELMICKGKLAEFECQESKFAEERASLLEESRKAYIKGCVHGAKDCATACVDLGVNRSFEEIIGHFRHLQSQRLDVP
ncbi:uncharacterized protein G2W53_029899 [Senna tora]|uniref:Uncharacterized protein n=1 Tax=Senna tora TaxID=362788 RepID=A0A834WA79_9FABA|nr:uncharacterized protein G2W53_029899 [Senna tora]